MSYNCFSFSPRGVYIALEARVHHTVSNHS